MARKSEHVALRLVSRHFSSQELVQLLYLPCIYYITQTPRFTCERIHFFLEQQKIKERSFQKSWSTHKGNFMFTSVDDFVSNFNFEFTYASFQTLILHLYTAHCAQNKHIL